MKLKLKINESTTDSELVHLGMFFTALGMNRGAHVVSAPGDEAEYTVIFPQTNTTEQELRDGELGKTEGIKIYPGGGEVGGPGLEAPKRRRRTKEEIAAAAVAASEAHAAAEAAAVAAAEAEAQASNEAALAAIEAAAEDAAKAEAGKGQPAPTPSVEPQDTPPSETASTQSATESPSDTKTYTPAEVQKIAVATAGRFGPEKVKAIIAQYPGAARIADLPLTELAGFVAKLNAVS